MKRFVLFAGALAATVSPAIAKKEKIVFVETAAVKDKPTVALDPAKAYILLRSDVAIPVHLMRVPSSEDQAGYDRLRASAFAEARERYAKRKAAYDRAVAVRAQSRSSSTPLPENPTEPTEGNFEFTPFGLLTGVSIGPYNRFSKGAAGEKTSTYVQEVTPGTYRIYGLLSVMPNGAVVGSCFCMGSVKFEARAGEITDLGRFAERELSKRETSDSAMPAPFAVGFRQAVAGMAIDPRLSNMPVRPAGLKPVGKLPNYYGIAIDRFPAIDGVIRYERDRVIDLTGGR